MTKEFASIDDLKETEQTRFATFDKPKVRVREALVTGDHPVLEICGDSHNKLHHFIHMIYWKNQCKLLDNRTIARMLACLFCGNHIYSKSNPFVHITYPKLYFDKNEAMYYQSSHQLFAKLEKKSIIYEKITQLYCGIVDKEIAHINQFDSNDEEKLKIRKEYTAMYEWSKTLFGSERKKDEICRTFIAIVSVPDSTFYREAKFDQNPNIMVWSCGTAYDCSRHTLRRITTEDMIMETTGYPFPKFTPEKKKLAYDFLWSCFESEDLINTVLSVFAQNLRAYNQHEKIVYFLGNGGNSKGLISELISRLYGKFYGSPAIDVFYRDASDSHDTHLAELAKYRCAVFDEPRVMRPFDASRINRITGGGIIRARGAYQSESSEFTIRFTPICLINFEPRFTGESSDAIARRVVRVKFPFRFVDKLKYDNMDEKDRKNIRIADPTCKSRIKNDDRIRDGLLELVLEAAKKYNMSIYQTRESIINTDISLEVSEEMIEEFKLNFIYDSEASCTGKTLITMLNSRLRGQKMSFTSRTALSKLISIVYPNTVVSKKTKDCIVYMIRFKNSDLDDNISVTRSTSVDTADSVDKKERKRIANKAYRDKAKKEYHAEVIKDMTPYMM
jgi:hypothetical protein